jgi:ELWxxDGT repeat protein
MLRDINPGGVLGSDSDPGGFTVMGDRIFFSANDGVHGLELWASDGTSAGTKMIVDLSPDSRFLHHVTSKRTMASSTSSP